MDRVAQIAPRGLLLISPGEDRLVSPHQSQRMFRAAGEPKELFVVPGAAHAEAHLTAPEAYERRVLDFLARHLDGEAARIIARTSIRPRGAAWPPGSWSSTTT